MRILGIAGLFHDGAAALVEDGRLVAFAEEERFVGEKHAHGRFPYQAIAYCLAEGGGLSVGDIDHLAFYFDPERALAHDLEIEPFRSHFAERPTSGRDYAENLLMISRSIHDYACAHGVPLTILDHHDCHLAAAFFSSPFEKARLISLDARGEVATTVLAVGEGLHLRRVAEVAMPHSLGMLYSSVTAFLGFPPFDGEGTVMGLSAYGRPRFLDRFGEILRLTEDGFTTSEEAYWSGATVLWLGGRRPGLCRFFGEPRARRPDPRDGTDEDIAASLQKATENVAKHLADILIEAEGPGPFCLGGGVALNAHMNGALRLHPGVTELFVPPFPNDPGCAVGAAFLLWARLTGRRPEPILHPYWGPKWEGDSVRRAILEAGVRFRPLENPAKTAAELVAEGKVVGWFQGRMEGGPRALGNRSILAFPGDPGIKNRVNDRVKLRESWRPFGPTVLDRYAAAYLAGEFEAPWMTMALPASALGREALAAAVHVDGTARVQVLRREVSPLYYELIEEVGRRTGVYGVLNTSFNVKGAPVVNHPRQALEVLTRTRLDAVVIGDYLVWS